MVLDVVREMALAALARHGVDAEVSEIVGVPEKSRRRATFKAAKKAGAVLLGFRARASHDIVDMHECRVLAAPIVAVLPRLRAMLAALLRDGEETELHLTETETGLDLALSWKRTLKPSLLAELARWAADAKLARIHAQLDGGGAGLGHFARFDRRLDHVIVGEN